MSEQNNADIEQDVYAMLMKVFYLLDDCDHHFLAEYSLSVRQFWALKHLDEEHGCSMVDLSRALFTDKSNMTGIVDRLERLNLAVRVPASHDRRVFLIKLTSEGRRLYDSVNQQHEELIRELLGIGSNESLHTLLQHLTAISANVAGYLEQVSGAGDTSVA